jgi:SAM-dependent methyltransferase
MIRTAIANMGRKLTRFESVRLTKLVANLDSHPDFPSSSSSPRQFLELTLLGARNNYSQLVELSGKKPLKSIALENFLTSSPNTELAKKLSNLFSSYGSDKSGTHNYFLLYSEILKNRLTQHLDILEIGIGSNNLDVPSNMGRQGTPGASLRSFRDLNENIQVTGADIDERILFSEDRITTYQLDQLSDTSWTQFKTQISGRKFDLIIDDGLHSPIANLATIKNMINFLKPGGLMVIEDIHERSLPVWETFELLTRDRLGVVLVKTKAAYVALITS